jgi:acetamidase/formamidase
LSGTTALADEDFGLPYYSVPDTKTHTTFSAAQEPALRVPSGSVIEMFTHEATGGQFKLGSDNEDLETVDFSQVHTMTGPIYVEGAKPGDVLKVELLELEVADWGWMALLPQFGIFAGEINRTSMRTFEIDRESGTVEFADGVVVPLKPFAGLMGVAPAAGSPLDTFPPRANGGNMDNPALTKGTTVYFPVFTEGALFSIGDTHAVQGFGEVSGTALEAPMRVELRLSVLGNARPIQEPQYETADYYATTGFAPTLEEAAKKATRYMMDYLMAEKGLSEEDAYFLCSIAGDLLIAEMVDHPNMLVTMHMPKTIFIAK